MTKRKKIIYSCIGAAVALQVGTYLLFATRSIPSLALRLTPEHTHFAKGAKFHWVWLQVDRCKNLSSDQKAGLIRSLNKRYGAVHETETDIPQYLIRKDSTGRWMGYEKGFAFSFSQIARGPFWVKVRHSDRVGNQAASSGEHFYVWILFGWVKVHQGPMEVS